MAYTAQPYYRSCQTHCVRSLWWPTCRPVYTAAMGMFKSKKNGKVKLMPKVWRLPRARHELLSRLGMKARAAQSLASQP